MDSERLLYFKLYDHLGCLLFKKLIVTLHLRKQLPFPELIHIEGKLIKLSIIWF